MAWPKGVPRKSHVEVPETMRALEEDPGVFSPQWMIESLLQWEDKHLSVIDAKQQNVEFGIVAGEIQKIGERCNRRLLSATQGKCGACQKPLANVRIFNQVSIFNPQTGKFDEMYACSSKCSDKLVDLQHKRAVAQQAEA